VPIATTQCEIEESTLSSYFPTFIELHATAVGTLYVTGAARWLSVISIRKLKHSGALEFAK
jgi:hypothetical protein